MTNLHVELLVGELLDRCIRMVTHEILLVNPRDDEINHKNDHQNTKFHT